MNTTLQSPQPIHRSHLSSDTVTFRIENLKMDNLHLQRLGIKYYHLARLLESRHSDQSDRLTGRALDLGRLEPRLIADEEYMRTLFDDELITVLEGITPCLTPSASAQMFNTVDRGA